MVVGDTFTIGDYTYTVKNVSSKSVSAKVADTTKSSYGAIASPVAYGGESWTIVDLSDCFRDCTNMVAAPQITVPSGTNMSGCFMGCTLLVSAELPERCFNCATMFYGCTSLTTVNRIPLGAQNYSSMFDGCTSLAIAPSFPEPFFTNGSNGFAFMFEGCTSLVDVSLPATIYDGQSLSHEIDPVITGMFEGCTSLVTAPALPDRAKKISRCFRGCVQLTEPPTIPSGATDMSFCFEGCTSLETAPLIPSTVTTMRACFQDCSSLESPANIPANVSNMRYVYYGCRSMGGTLVAANAPTEYTFAFENVRNDIYVILAGSASEPTWRTIAQQYEHVYLFGDNSSPTVELSAFRSDSSGDADEEGAYANITAIVTIYEDSVPPHSNSVSSIAFKKDGTAMTPTWTESVSSLTYTYNAILSLGDTGKHVFALSATDAFDARSIEVSVILVSAAAVLDFCHGPTDNGAAFGKIATREGIVDSDWDYWEHGERMYPTFIRSSWSTSSDESTLPVTPCFVLDTSTGGLYWCDGQ